MKKFIKGAKLFCLLAVIMLGTKCFIRKSDNLSQNIEANVKNNLDVKKSYETISNSSPRRLNQKEKKQLVNQHPELNLQNSSKVLDSILLVNHKCRLNDTLFNVSVYVLKNNIVYAVDKPIKKF